MQPHNCNAVAVNGRLPRGRIAGARTALAVCGIKKKMSATTNARRAPEIARSRGPARPLSRAALAALRARAASAAPGIRRRPGRANAARRRARSNPGCARGCRRDGEAAAAAFRRRRARSRSGVPIAPIRNGWASSATLARIVARLFPVLLAPEVEKRRAAQFPEEERVRARADDAHGKFAPRVELEDERVGENAANGAGIDIVALRRAAGAAQFVPIGVELLTGGEFHCGLPFGSPRRLCENGTPPAVLPRTSGERAGRVPAGGRGRRAEVRPGVNIKLRIALRRERLAGHSARR